MTTVPPLYDTIDEWSDANMCAWAEFNLIPLKVNPCEREKALHWFESQNKTQVYNITSINQVYTYILII